MKVIRVNNYFSDNLKTLRKKFGYSQEDFSSLIGYSNKNVSKWETGQSVPSIDVLNEICEIFHLNNLSELINHKISYCTYDIEEDIAFLKSYMVNISDDSVKVYYTLINQNGELFDSSNNIIDNLVELKENEIIKEFTVTETDGINHVKCNLLDNSDLSIRSILKEKMYDDINFANDLEYEKYVESLSLPKQCIIVLNYIDDKVEKDFKLRDLYEDSLISELSNRYGKNSDHKKTIRTALTRLVEKGIIMKIGYASYQKKHHRIEYDFSFTDKDAKMLDNILHLKFDEYRSVRKVDIEEFAPLNLEKEKIMIMLNNYMIYLRNLNLLYDYSVSSSENYVDIIYYSEVE